MRRYKALIVDDEYAARQTLCRITDWERFGFEPPDTAENGRAALAMYSGAVYDLVFTDIEMPVMNGISLIEEMRAQNPAQRIVIISCHEKFEYAQKALKLGVDDYIIKDLLTERELAAYLSAFAMQDRQAQRQPAPAMPDLCGLLRAAATGLPLPGNAQLGYPMVAVFCAAADDGGAQTEPGARSVAERISVFLQALSPPAHYYPGGERVYLAFEVEAAHSTLYYYSHVLTLSNTVRAAARQQGLGSVSIGVSDPCGSADELPLAVARAEEAMQMRILTGLGRTVIYDTITLHRSALDYRRVEYLLDYIREYSFHANTACLRLIDKLYDMAPQNSFESVNYYSFVNSRLWNRILEVAQSHGRTPADVLASVGMSEQRVNSFGSSREMAEFFKTALKSLFAGDEAPENDNIVNRALRLIELEYTGDISLGGVAERLHTNKSYLSRVFKEQTGDNLMHYVMKRKMGRAEYLLQNTHMKLYEISDSLGFASPQYFSTVFKKHSGRSPQEFKKEAAEMV